VNLRLNKELVLPETLAAEDIAECRGLIANHFQYTKSTVAKRILDNWDSLQSKFVKVMPVDYKKALERIAKEKAAAAAKPELVGAK
jgi:glutamate synthase (ferredoxin)